MWRGVLLCERSQYFINSGLSDVYQHVCVRKPFHGSCLVSLGRRQHTIWTRRFSTIVLLQDLAVCYRSHAIVIIFEPAGFTIGLDEGKIMATMEITGMHKHTMQLVYPRLRSGYGFIKKFAKVNFKWEFMSVIDL